MPDQVLQKTGEGSQDDEEGFAWDPDRGLEEELGGEED